MEEIATLVEREVGASVDVLGKLAGGRMHETYAVRADGRDYVLQLTDETEGQETALSRGLNCYRLLRDTEIPVPDLVTAEVREFGDRQYVVVERLPGDSAYLDISPERVRNAGSVLSAIHDAERFETAGWLQFDDRGVSVEPFREGSLARWRHRKVLDNAEYLRSGGLEAAGREVERLFAEHRPESPDELRPVLCHNDFSPDNVIFRGATVTGVVDFDVAYAGSRYRDVAKAANGFWMHDPGVDWDVRATFYDGYREATDLGDSFEENEPLYRVETLAICVGGMARMDELSEEETDFYAERILAAIERVPRA